MTDMVVEFRGTIYENGYGQIAQRVMRDKNLSLEAKAIYSYIVSFAGQSKSAFPKVSTIMSELRIKSKDTFYKYRNELLSSGYLTIEERPRPQGKFTSKIYFIEPCPKKQDTVKPCPKNRDTENRDTENRDTEKQETIINSTQKKSIRNINNSNNNTGNNVVAESLSLSKLCEDIKEALGRKAGRQKVASLVQKYGEAHVRNVLAVVEKQNYIYHFPSPVGVLVSQCEDEWDMPAMKQNPQSESERRNLELFELLESTV